MVDSSFSWRALDCWCWGAIERLGRQREETRWPQIRRYSALLAGMLAGFATQSLWHPVACSYRGVSARRLDQERRAGISGADVSLRRASFNRALLLAGLITSGFLLRQRLFTEALWILFLAHASLTSVRHAPLYATVAAPLIAGEISEWWSAGVAGMKKSSALRILYQLGADLTPGFRRTSIWPAVFILSLAALDAPLKWPRDFPSEVFPTAMVHQHADLIASGRLLTTDQWGDYIIYSFYPRQKVYVDGRSDFYGEKLGQRVPPSAPRSLRLESDPGPKWVQCGSAAGGLATRIDAEKDPSWRVVARRSPGPYCSSG